MCVGGGGGGGGGGGCAVDAANPISVDTIVFKSCFLQDLVPATLML